MIAHKHKSKIEFVASGLRERIKSGELTPGTRLGCSADIAVEFGVSMMTADRAIRMLAAEGKLKRINGIGTFVLDDSPCMKICLLDNFYTSDHGQHAVLYSENTYPLIEQELMKYNALVRYCRSWEDIINLNPDGVLCSMPPPFDLHLKMPVALFRHYLLHDRPLIQCIPDLADVMRMICEKLITKKVRRIFVMTSRLPHVQYFADSFKEWLKLYGLMDITSFIPQSVKENQEAFLLGYHDGMALPDVRNCAVFITSDFRASGILKAFDERGLSPGDYDLISCNNWEAYGYRPFERPRLTSIDFRRKECLIEVVHQLCDSILEPKNGRISITRFPARLKIRESGLKEI